MRKTNRRFHRLCAGLFGFALFAICSALAGGVAAAAVRVQGEAYDPHQVIVGYSRGADFTAAEVRVGAQRATSGSAPDSQVLKLPSGESVATALARLRHQPGVAYALPDYIAHATGIATGSASKAGSVFGADEIGQASKTSGWEQMEWNLLPEAGVNAPQAWTNLIADHHPGGKGVVVAVLDTGVAYRNYKQYRAAPEFAGTRFVAPRDFIARNRFPLDRNGHGTFIAGMIAQSTQNRLGLMGLAYGVSIMPVRVLDASGEGDEATIARGIRYAVDHHAQVINLSLEFLPSQVASAAAIPEIVNAIAFAHRRGVVVVGAAGNDESDQISYPARTTGVISVGATTRDRCVADYSNGGPDLDLVAPGGGDDAIMPSDSDCHPNRNLPAIYQLTLVDPPHWGRFGYPTNYIGTSMATPEVSGTAALVIASGVIGRHPTPDQVLTRLEQTATPLGGSQPNPAYGWGLINAGAATAPNPAPAAPTTTTTPATPTPAPTSTTS